MKLRRLYLLLPLLAALPAALLQAAAFENPKTTAVKQPSMIDDGAGLDSLSLPPAAFSRKGGHIGTDLARCMHVAQQSLDIAVYNFDYSALKTQLKKALDRGVKVRLIMNAAAAYSDREGKMDASPLVNELHEHGAEIRTLRGRDDSYRGTQHNKFMIVDRALVETGSFNWVLKLEKENAENVLFLKDATTVKAFQTYFEFMWKQAHELGHDTFNTDPLPETSDFYSPVLSSPGVEFNGEKFPAASFSPLGGTGASIVKAINSASASIDAAVFSVNLYAVVDALIAAKKRGVKVRVVTDYMQAVGESQAPGTKKLLDAKIDLRINDGHASGPNDGNMHHKFAIFDGKLVESGSFNWSFGGEARNYDNAVFTTDEDTASAFKAEFNRVFSSGRPVNLDALANGINRANETTAKNAEKTRQKEDAAGKER